MRESANDLSREISDGKGIGKSGFLQTVEKRRRYFTAGNINRWPDITSEFRGQGKISGEILTPTPEIAGNFTPTPGIDNPVFIVGFPRSGTTLLDTLLRGAPVHPGSGRSQRRAGVMVNRLSGESDERLETLTGPFRTATCGGSPDVPISTHWRRHVQADDGVLPVDRFALNTVYAGEIHRIFPEARFILMLRHPADCVLSCFHADLLRNPGKRQLSSPWRTARTCMTGSSACGGSTPTCCN